MLPINLQITLCIAVIIYFLLIMIFLKKRTLELKYTLLWLLAGVVMAFFIFFPRALYNLVRAFGIESAMNGLYVMCIGFIIILLMSLTSIVSRQTNKIRVLIQENAMLEKRIRDLEKAADNTAAEGEAIKEKTTEKSENMQSVNLEDIK